ncbi:MAG: hypothetical protein ACRDY1_00560 [Acidimicrobiales bacterium]
MLICQGCQVLHRDGSVAYCTRELDGRACEGVDRPHLGGVLACRVTVRAARCRYCDMVMQRRLAGAPRFVPEQHRPDLVVPSN